MIEKLLSTPTTESSTLSHLTCPKALNHRLLFAAEQIEQSSRFELLNLLQLVEKATSPHMHKIEGSLNNLLTELNDLGTRNLPRYLQILRTIENHLNTLHQSDGSSHDLPELRASVYNLVRQAVLPLAQSYLSLRDLQTSQGVYFAGQGSFNWAVSDHHHVFLLSKSQILKFIRVHDIALKRCLCR